MQIVGQPPPLRHQCRRQLKRTNDANVSKEHCQRLYAVHTVLSLWEVQDRPGSDLPHRALDVCVCGLCAWMPAVRCMAAEALVTSKTQKRHHWYRKKLPVRRRARANIVDPRVAHGDHRIRLRFQDMPGRHLHHTLACVVANRDRRH